MSPSWSGSKLSPANSTNNTQAGHLEMTSSQTADVNQPVSSFVNEGSLLRQNDTIENLAQQDNKRAVTSNLFQIQDQALIESMSRSIIIGSGLWESTDAQISSTMTRAELDTEFSQPTLFEADLPGKLFEVSPMLKGKFANIAYFTADCEVEMRIQGTPFLQGILRIGQIPYAKGTTRERRVYNEHLRSLSTFPGVTLNMQNPSRTVKLYIPYVNEYQNINPSDNDGLSSVRVWVISEIASAVSGGASARASWTMTARLTNIKLYGMAPSETTKQVHSLSSRTLHPSAPGILQCQDGEDESASKEGIVTKVANTVANVADVLSDVPVISSIAKPIGWASRMAAKVASLFGFSKAVDLEKNSVYSNVPARGFTHCEGIDQGVSLSVLPDNAIDATKAVSSQMDEMSIAHIASKPYMLERYKWSVDDVDETVLLEIPVHPSNYSTYGSDFDGQRVFFTAPIGLVSRLAHWWRGQININLTFAKTQFHQGRLKVQYLPYGTGVQGIETVMTDFVDISQVDHCGIQLTWPTVIQNKWLNTADNSTDGWTQGSSGGVVVISVLNQLIAADTVAQEVTIVPEISWSDFEIAEQTSIAKVAVATNYVPPTPSTASQLASEDSVVEFSVQYPAEVSFISGRVGVPAGTDGFLKIASVGGSFSQNLVEYIIDSARERVTTKRVSVAPGSYRISPDGINGFSTYRIMVNRPVVVSKGSVLDTGEIVYTGVPNVGDSTQIPDERIVYCPEVSFEYNTGTYVELLSVTPGPVSLMEHKIDSPQGWQFSIVTLALGSAGVESTVEGAVWQIYDPAATVLECQDYQEGDESSRLTTIGEVIPSLRLLTRRFTKESSGSGFAFALGTPSLKTPASLEQSLFSVISWLYRFTSGSLRYKIISQTDDILGVISTNSDSTGSSASPGAFDIASAAHLQSMKLNPIMEVAMPFYSPAEQLAISSTTFDLTQPVVGSVTGNSFDYTVLAAAGDDHTFSFMIGCPAFTV